MCLLSTKNKCAGTGRTRVFLEKARPKEAWVWSEEGEGMAEKGEDVRDFRRGLRFGTRGSVLVERKTIANGRVSVCCSKNKNRKREDEEEAWRDGGNKAVQV
jgi:hypothetical protein